REQCHDQNDVQTPDSGTFEFKTEPYILIEHTPEDRKLMDKISTLPELAEDPDIKCATKDSDEAVLKHSIEPSKEASAEADEQVSEDASMDSASEDSGDRVAEPAEQFLQSETQESIDQTLEDIVLKHATEETDDSAAKRTNEPSKESSLVLDAQVPEDASMASDDECLEDPVAEPGEQNLENVAQNPAEQVLTNASVEDILPLTAEMTLNEDLGNSLDEITQLLPTPEELFSPKFEHIHLDASSFEPSHTLTIQRIGGGMSQSTYEYRLGDFISPVDPCLWLQFMRRKFSHWATSHSKVESVDVRLIPQQYNCRTTNKYHQPQCRGCIKRISDQRCGFANIRYTAQLQIKLVD
ncbi:hypothetical protein LPJ73_007404, partial [Coemansia sp. RSA 2703]